MKYLLIPLALFAGQAMACPGDKSKDAMAAPDNQSQLVATAPSTLSNALTTAPVTKTSDVKAVGAKSDSKVAVKADARKPL
ncbi:MAG: hypothetical protein AD742_20900 [Methylibium sp. NZG]|nr:MAG: hypothetical protein AD742_20900 [Methylibium sp. NZG]